MTLAVVAPEEVRVRRVMRRDAISEPYARARVAAQKPNEYYVNLCDFTVYTDDSTMEEKLFQQVAQMFSCILC